ncbi:MAG: acetylglutamate kinase, partial [Firmicutes bacterium]|nr:acetylglutamate kinase [Bacillota bacterium]
VHGGGPEITKMLAAAKIPNEFKNGLRVTSKEAMAVVCDALDHINKDIVGKLNALGVKAVGLNGKDAKLIEVVKMKDKTKTDYGFVGDITLINPQILETLIPNYVPVIATIGVDKNGESYNINADIAASAIGGALKAAKLVYLTDVDGVRMDEKKPETLISEICLKEVDKMIESGKICGGMLPKVLSCVNAIKGGIGNVSIINGTISHSILLELFTAKGIGTMFTQ